MQKVISPVGTIHITTVKVVSTDECFNPMDFLTEDLQDNLHETFPSVYACVLMQISLPITASILYTTLLHEDVTISPTFGLSISRRSSSFFIISSLVYVLIITPKC